MVKMMMALAAICALGTAYVATNAMAEEDVIIETSAEDVTDMTEDMSDGAEAEFKSDVDCVQEAMDGGVPSEECLSQDDEGDSDTIIIDEQATDDENVE